MIRNIAIGGYIGAGTTSLGKVLADKLGWRFVEGGGIFASIHKDLGLAEEKVVDRPDSVDNTFDEKMRRMFEQEERQVIESHLAAYNALAIPGVFKIRLVCEEDGKDREDIRVSRVAKRDGLSIEEATRYLRERESGNIEKYQRLYGINPYTDASLYDLTINTFEKGKEEVFREAINTIENS